MLYSLLLLVRLHDSAWACGVGSASRDSEIITDPTFRFTVSPPVRWTYFIPISSTATPVTNYFPGQSQTSELASQIAQNDIMASYLEAVANSNYPVVGSQLTTTTNYLPDPISNCYTTVAIPAGTLIGYLSSGTITQVARVTGTGGQGVTVSNCPLSETMVVTGVGPYEQYSKDVSVSTRGGLTMTRFNWDRVANQMQSILNFRYRVIFNSPITIE